MSSRKKKKDKKSIWKRLLKTVLVLVILAGIGGVGYHYGLQITQFVQIKLAEYEIYEGRSTAAINTYRYAIRVYQDNPKPYYSLAELYEDADNDYQALRVYQAGFEATNDPELGNRADALTQKLFPKVIEQQPLVKESPIAQSADIYPSKVTVLDSEGKGEVSSYTYDADNNVTAIVNSNERGDFLGRSEYVYGPDGRLTESKEYVLRFGKTYTYNDNGFLVAETGTYYDENPGVVTVRNTDLDGYVTVSNNGSYVINYTLDALGHVETAEIVTGDDNTHVITNTYTKAGNLEKRIDNEKEYEYSFDDDGNIATVVSYDDENIRNTDTYSYADNGQLSSVVRIRENRYIVEEQDSRGRITEVEVWEPCFESSTVYSYANGNVETILQYENGDILYSYTYHYDEKGILASCIYYNYTSKVLSSVESYSYDEHGNLMETNTYYPFADKNFTTVNSYNAKGQSESSIKKYYGEDVGTLEEDKFIAYSYDEEGRIVEESSYFIDSYSRIVEDESDTEDGGSRLVYSDYDPLGKKMLTTVEMYDRDGRLYFRTTTNPDTNRTSLYERFIYDDWGEVGQTIYYNEATVIDHQESRHRDENGFVDYLIKAKEVRGEQKYYRTEDYTYNADNRLEAVACYDKEYHEYYSYDKKGRLTAVRKVSSRTGKLLQSTLYEY